MYVHGGTIDQGTPYGQTFSIDLSTNWTTLQPAFTPLPNGFQDYLFASALMNNGNTWFSLSNKTAYNFCLTNLTWNTLGSVEFASDTKGISAATDPTTGLVYIVNGYTSNGTLAMQEYNPDIDRINLIEMNAMLKTIINSATAWSTRLGALLVHGGMIVGGGTVQRSLFQYLPGSRWSQLPDKGDLPPARKSHCMIPAYNGTKMVVFGGIDQTGAVMSDIYILDTGTLVWIKGTDGGAAVARANTACAVTNDLFIAWGGSDSTFRALTGSNTVIYNMKTQAWQTNYMPNADNGSNPSPSYTGAIIGGVVGSAAVIACTVGFLFYKRRKDCQPVPTNNPNDGTCFKPGYYDGHASFITSPTLTATSATPNYMGHLSLRVDNNGNPLYPDGWVYSDNRCGGDNYAETAPIYAFANTGMTEEDLSKRDDAMYRPNEILPGRSPQAITQWRENGGRNPQGA
ncbi:Acyl-CoA-binding domain-containing protein 5 [Modicella reniformis]|uniref:Acyl-CoA-binding domain-containing protein 5 n=1 Tax=Modicella reniformis TaxID=1440133 RepID=A0A9P6LYA4_9FUNG|nr:Acyl-CoA-binding domain-containing protein 5 [Modicella reniformis]